MMHKDTLGADIEIGDQVLWSGGTQAGNGFYNGVMTVVALTPKLVRVNYVGGTKTLMPSHLVVVNAAIERIRDKQHCMCGNHMDAHDYNDGHTPVSVWDYHNTPKPLFTQ